MAAPDPSSWLVEYDGYGTVEATTSGTIVMQPGYVTPPATAAALTSSVATSTGDVTLRARMRTLEQRPNGNPWETAWIWWNYGRVADPNAEQGTDTNDGYARHGYYLCLKPNGYELGKIDQQVFTGALGGQRYLVTDSTPTFPIDGTWRDVEITQTGAAISVRVDGAALCSFTDGPGSPGEPPWMSGESVFTSGGVALYTEDARVEFADVTLNGRQLLPPNGAAPMSLETSLRDFATAVGGDIKSLRTSVASPAWASITDKPAFATVATTGAYADLTGRPTIPDTSVLAPKDSPTFTGTVTFTGATVTGLSKSSVGLGNVDNTADAAKTFAASQVTSGVFSPARLGTGTANASTFLSGDGTYKAAPATTDASLLTTGTVAPARLGTGTASASTFLTGASTYVTVNKTTVGLDRVDNTMDSEKTFSAAQVTSGVFARARLGSGAGTAGDKFLSDDGTWKATPSGGTATTDASQLTTGTLANARLSTAVPLISRDPATRPTTDPNVMVQFWCTTQPTAMLTNDVWMQTA